MYIAYTKVHTYQTSDLYNELTLFDSHIYLHVTGSDVKITFVSEKHVVDDDVLFTNHLVGK